MEDLNVGKQTQVKPFTSNTMEELVELLLEREAKQGQPPLYEARLDHRKVIDKTRDPDPLITLEDRMGENTDLLTVKVYHGNSNNNETLHFPLTDQGALMASGQGVRKKPNGLATIGQLGGLAGMESVEDHVSKTVQQARRDWEFELVRKENAELKKENRELKERTDISGIGEIVENALPVLGPMMDRFTGGQAQGGPGMSGVPQADNVQFGNSATNEALLVGKNMLALKKSFSEDEWKQLTYVLGKLREHKALVPQFALICRDYQAKNQAKTKPETPSENQPKNQDQ